MAGRKSRYIRELLDWYRGEDAGVLKRSVLDVLVENMTFLNTLEGKIWKSNPKIVMDENSEKIWKSNQKIAKNEELDQNSVMNGKFVKNFVMNAKSDPKVVAEISRAFFVRLSLNSHQVFQ